MNNNHYMQNQFSLLQLYSSFWIFFYVKKEICWKWPNTDGIINATEYALSQNYWNCVCLIIRNESINNQGVKLKKKNHKFWSVNSPPGAEFSLTSNLMQTLFSTLNNVSETPSRSFSIANPLHTRFCPFMQIPESKQFSRQHKMILCILQ